MIWRRGTIIGEHTIATARERGCGFPCIEFGINDRLILTGRFGDISRTGDNDCWCRVYRKGSVTGLRRFTIRSDGESNRCCATTMIWRSGTIIGEHTIATTGEGGCGFPGIEFTVDGCLILTGHFSDIGRTRKHNRWGRVHCESCTA